MTHLIVGYPSLDANWRMLELMDRAKVDMVECQMPFSEPIADGATFTRANQRAVAAGIRVDQYFGFLHRASQQFGFPVLMMGYYNTVFRLGHETFCEKLKASGGTGFIIPDLPLEEYGDLFQLSEANELTPIVLMTPTNTIARLQEIGKKGKGFVYVVARRGVTGKQTRLEHNLEPYLERCREATDLPLALGFGLQQAQDLKQLQGRVEMAIVGSVLLETWENGGPSEYEALLDRLQDARF